MRFPGPARYRWSARIYDVISLDRPLYLAGRLRGIDLLHLQPGQIVLDVGCGTGLNFAHLQAQVGPTGRIVGVDNSAQMLAQARRRAQRAGWSNVVLLRTDAAELDPATVRDATSGLAGADAVLATYALSVITGWEQAWTRACLAAAPGARFAVVDLALPTGRASWLTPLARLACAAGGSDPHRDPGMLARRAATDLTRVDLRGGHVTVDAGTLSGPAPHP